jgi:menaquinone-dependent protoporphyrinogen oxidase
MSRLLILFGTTDGQTGKIARFLADQFRGLGHEADLVEGGQKGLDPDPASYAAVVVATSVHLHSYQRGVRRWARDHAAGLREKPNAFISVCLGVLQDEPEVRRELDEIVQQFVKQTGWQPGRVKFVAGALPYSRYSWITKWVMRRIARKAGVETDWHRDYEYTDWEDLRKFAAEFSREVSGQ